MRKKVFTLAMALLFGVFAVNAQQNDLKKERVEKFSQVQKQEASTKFLKGTPTTATRAIEGMPDATYNNIPTDFETGVTSNIDAGYIVAQKIAGFADPVSAFRFYGIQGIYSDAWNPMNDVDPFEFQIKFYADNAGTPGAEIYSETVSLNHVNTEVMFAEVYQVFHWDYTPSSPITGLSETFWIGIANTNTDAWFMWINTPSGQGSGAQYDIAASTWAVTDYPCGISIVPVLTEPDAPAAPTNFVVTPEPAGALIVDISWNNPALDFAGDALAELTSVSLYDADDMATPIYTNAAPVVGDSETYSTTVSVAGNYTFTVIGSNSAGDGVPASVSVYIGEDVPAAPTNVVLAKDEMEAQLSWDAPTVGLQGGFFDGTGVTYDVYRMPGNVQVATAQSGTTFTETLSVPGNYSYNVVASNATGIGGNATSNVLLFGNFLIYEMFDEATMPAEWTTQGLGLTNWSVATTVVAGGDANELKFSWTPSFTGASYFVSPVINTTGMGSLGLNYKDMFNDYNTNPKTIGVKTTIDGGATWLVASEEIMINGNVDIGPRDNTVVIENEHVGSPNFQFAFFYDGYTFDIDGWNIDNIELVNLAGANVTFTVKEGTDLLEGAVVNINANNHTTAADGTVTAYVLEGTDIPYTVTKLGWGDVTGTITVVDGVDQDVDVQLVSVSTYSVTFNVMDVDSEPLDALVTLELAGNAVASEVATGGAIVFSGIPDGDYTYVVTMPLYLPANGSFEVAGTDVIVPDVTLTYDPDIVIGTGAVTGQACPVNGYFGYTYSQSIYLKSEIANMPMTVTHVKYYFNGTSLSNSNDWTIYMGHTDKSEFASATDWLPMAELTEVYSEVFTSPTGAGWIEFDITDFDYNGVDNLVIAVDENTPDYNSSSDRFLNSAVAGNRSVAKYSDSENPDPNNPGEGNYFAAYIPNTILTAYPKPGANVNFSVIDGTNPVEDAVIVVDAKTFTTLADGTVTAYVGEGTDVPFTVNKFGYEQFDGIITVVDGVDQDVDVTMVALPTYSVTVNIKNILNEPLDATVTAYFEGEEIVSETAVAGEIVFTDVPVGSYTYDVVFDGYITQADLSLEIVDESVSEEVFLLEVMEIPYSLSVDVNNVDKTALLSWNGSFSGSVLLVDHDGTTAVPEFTDAGAIMATTLDDLGLDYTLVESDVSNNGPTYDVMQEYDAIIWITGEGWQSGQTMTATDQTNLALYLDNGGKLIFSSQDHVWDVYSQDDNYTFAAGEFAYDYFGLRSVQQDPWWSASPDAQTAQGSVGSFAEGMTLNLVDVYTTKEGLTTDNITDHVGIPVIDITMATAGLAAIKYQNTIFSSASLVAIADTDARANFIMEALTSLLDKNEKTFVGFNVYLDGSTTPANPEPLEETSYLFEGLEIGAHTAGVETVYTTGASEIVTIDFAIEDLYTVTFNVTDGANPVEGANVSINSVELTTDVAGVAAIELADGTYDFTVTAAGFEDYSESVIVNGDNISVNVNMVGMADFAKAQLSIYPNPSNGTFNITLDGQYDVAVLNSLGQVVYNKNITDQDEINLGNITSGIYFVTVKSNTKFAAQSIVVE